MIEMIRLEYSHDLSDEGEASQDLKKDMRHEVFISRIM